MHIDKLKEAFNIQSKIEFIDTEIKALDDTVARIQGFQKDAIIRMNITVDDPDNIPEEAVTKTIISGPEDWEKFKKTLNTMNDYYNKQTSLTYNLTESDLLVIFSDLLKMKKESKEVYINKLKELGVTYELSKGKTKRSEKTR